MVNEKEIEIIKYLFACGGATARKFEKDELESLEKKGYLFKDEKGRYEVTKKSLNLLNRVWNNNHRKGIRTL